MNPPVIFVIGAPRSGTTLLGRILGCHPQIETLVEPYYIWDHFFREHPDDERCEKDATEKVSQYVHKRFASLKKLHRADYIIDKSPRNSLKIPFIKKIFPDARYIFILRDGREATLSINNRWKAKGKISHTYDGRSAEKNYQLKKWLKRRTFFKQQLEDFLFMIGPPTNWLNKNFLPKIRWGDRFGWGPRFKGWQDCIDRMSLLEFNAYQWKVCVEEILKNLSTIPKDRQFVLKYEELTKEPERVIRRIFSYLDIYCPENLMKLIPKIRRNNHCKWRRAFSPHDLLKIGPILTKPLIELGYEEDNSWYTKS